MNTAIIVAAGTGTRFGGDIPKQYRLIHGKPLLFHTLTRFEDCSAIDAVILVVAREYLDSAGKFQESFAKIQSIVAGGTNRAESVRNGLEAVQEDGIVAVHDGARPLIEPEDIAHTVEAAEDSGAACLVSRVTDTIKLVKEGVIDATVNRDTLRSAQTPQAFRVELLKRAYKSFGDLSQATDECSLVEAIGHPITIVEGRPSNIKVTTEMDLRLAGLILEQARGKEH
ncbi:MAG: 2-C-methyl-D-erythritol 4-phosphate cytidylyltransferase [Pyrinomonadaceae bacterium]|nr:2-C-methyl-D-erythritol 4-phosphate cytidylyltransferase [Pyrinomonadaceae bacterium]